jgi:uncharacterized protein (DUF488 family)
MTHRTGTRGDGRDGPVFVLTIGHSNGELNAFIKLLRQHVVEVLVYTRSQPYSRYSPHSSRETLSHSHWQRGGPCPT